MKDLAKFSRNLIKITFFTSLFVTPFIFTSLTSELFEIPKMIFIYLLTSIFVCLYFLYCFSVRKIIITKNPVFFFFTIFILVLGISTIFSTDHHLSIFGYYTRLNGSLISTVCYLLIFFVTSSIITKKEAFEGLKFLTFSGLCVSIWGIPGHFGYDPNCFVLTGKLTSVCWREEFQPTLRIFSTFGQPNWLGAFLAMNIPITISLFTTTKGFQKLIFLGSSLVILWALIFTNSRSAFLALIISLFLFFVLLGFKKIKTNLVTLIIFFVGSAFLLGTFGRPLWERNLEAIRQNLFFSVKPAIENTSPEPTPTSPKPPSSTSLESGGTESGTIRLIVWQGAWDIFRHSPILGSGPETFATTYYRFRPVEHNQTTEWNFLYNKAHNEYLNFLSGTGSLGFLSYILLTFAILLMTLKAIFTSKNQTRTLQLGLFSSAASYLVVNFFGFSVTSTSLLFFLIPAVSYALSENRNEHIIKLPKTIPLLNTIVASSVFIIFILLTVTVSRIFLADTFYSRYQKEIASGKILRALKYIQTASATMPYFEPLYYAEVGYSASLAAENSFDTEKQSFIALAEESTAKALNNSPNNLGLWRKAQSTYFELSLSDPKYLSLALNAGTITTTLAPTDPATFYNLGLIQKTAGLTNEARSSFQTALKLKPDYLEAKNEIENLDSK